MAQEVERDPTGPTSEAKKIDADAAFWTRVQEHKIIQWGIGYVGAALALAQGQELVGREFDWPEAVGRIVVVALIAGFPIALTLAWYHGHRGLTRISAGELTIISLLLLIGAVFFTVSLRPEADRAEPAVTRGASSVEGERPAVGGEAPVIPRPAESQNGTLANSVAVLPFDNLSPNPDDAYFAAGIHEQVINQLAKINDLTVIARTAVLAYADRKASTQEIGRVFDIEAVMVGSVRYADGNVRISVELIDAGTEAQLWSETYTRPFENIFAIETDIATQIAAALEAELAPSEQRNLEKVPTQSPEAYAHFLRAIAVLPVSIGALGVSSEESAEFHRHLDRALEVDPEFALGYAAKARDFAYSMGRFIPRAAGLSFEDRATIAVTNAQRALALDAETGLAYAALSTMHRLSGRWQDAELALEQALAVSPNDFQVLADAVLLNVSRGNTASAMEFAQRAARLNPVDGYLLLGIAFRAAGDYDAAAEQFASRPDVPSNILELAVVELRRGNTAAVIRNLRDLEERGIRPPASIPNVAYLYHLAGADDDARRVVAMLEEFAADYAVGPGDWALAALSTGDDSAALRWLEQAAARAAPGPGWQSTLIIARNAFPNPVLERPEFVEVRKRLPQ
jgi:TolB-like protein/Flp pilus assembly protein TadD